MVGWGERCPKVIIGFNNSLKQLIKLTVEEVLNVSFLGLLPMGSGCITFPASTCGSTQGALPPRRLTQASEFIIFIGVPLHKRLTFFFFWPHLAACGILVPQTGIELMSSALGAYSPNHWTARKSHTSPTFGPLFPPTWESQEDLPTYGRCLLCPPSRT